MAALRLVGGLIDAATATSGASDGHAARSALPLALAGPPGGVTARRPRRRATVTEPVRAGATVATLPASAALLRAAPRGDGGPVLFLPGLLASDVSTAAVRTVLRRLGHDIHGWGAGRNIGPTSKALDGLRRRLDELAQEHQRPVTLLGWSLGGLFARAMASEQPEHVRQVVTLGSPFALEHRHQTIALRCYELFGGLHEPGYTLPMPSPVKGPMPVPATSIWSRSDGIVSWTSSIEPSGPQAENICVRSSHVGLAFHPGALWAVADRLAQPADHWRPFQPPARLRRLYADAAGR